VSVNDASNGRADREAITMKDAGLLVLRLGFVSVLIWKHGIDKISAFSADPIEFFDPIGLGPALSLTLAAFAEIVCAAAVAAGIFSRTACAILGLNFAVIVLVLHGAQVPGDRGELALLFMIAFGVLLVTGPGRYSLDEQLAHRAS